LLLLPMGNELSLMDCCVNTHTSSVLSAVSLVIIRVIALRKRSLKLKKM
jgi:hypothetical protein